MLHYLALAHDLERIRRYLASESQVDQTSDQRRFSYIACISALYSAFENYTEKILFNFSQLLMSDPDNFTIEQSEKLKSRYVRNASILLTKGLGTGRYTEVTELDIARSLTSCLDDSDNYRLHSEVISLHNSNLRWDTLGELFHWAVPDFHGRVQRSDAIEEWAVNAGSPAGNQVGETLENELKDLVERRNEVAHRAIPEEILSLDNLQEKVTYVQALCIAMLTSLSAVLIETTAKSGKSKPLGAVTERFQRNTIVVIPSLMEPVSVGDTVWFSNSSILRWGLIKEIHIEDKPAEYANRGIEVGLKLDFSVSKSANLFIWTDPSPDLAELPEGIFGSHGPLKGDEP